MLRSIAIVVIICATLCPTPVWADTPAAGCAPIQPLFENAVCQSNERGVAIATTSEKALQLLSYAEAARPSFEVAFQTPAGTYAIIEAGQDGIATSLKDQVRQAGFDIVLVWLSVDGYAAQIENSVRKSVEARLLQSGLDEKAREATVASAIAQTRQQLTAQSSEKRDATAIPHELGHHWFQRAFWPAAEETAQHRYGSPGPDWMDELAAVIVEPEASQNDRREQFWHRYHVIKVAGAVPSDANHRLLDLAAYLQNEHPMLSAAARISKEAVATGKTGFQVITGNDAMGASQNAALFYLQSQLVADFLKEASGNPAIFAVIARSLAQGRPFGDWLAMEGAAHGLPTSESGFVGAWLDWLDRKARLRPPMKDASATG